MSFPHVMNGSSFISVSFLFFLLNETWGKWLARELAGDRAHTTQPYANIPTRHTPHFHCAFEDEMTKRAGAPWCQTVEDFIWCGTPHGLYSRQFCRPDDVCIRDIDQSECALLRFGCVAFYCKMFFFGYIILYYIILSRNIVKYILRTVVCLPFNFALLRFVYAAFYFAV